MSSECHHHLNLHFFDEGQEEGSEVLVCLVELIVLNHNIEITGFASCFMNKENMSDKIQSYRLYNVLNISNYRRSFQFWPYQVAFEGSLRSRCSWLVIFPQEFACWAVS